MRNPGGVHSLVRGGIYGLFILLLVSGSAQAAIPATERQALIDLYNGTNGAGWTTSTAWKTPPLDVDGFAMPGTECSWYGVVCNGGQTTVTSISLSSNNLVGPLPATVGNLVGLRSLSLYNNQLSGSIPSFAANTALLTLALESNQLSGAIPSFATNTALQYLALAFNQLSGAIPSFATNTALLRLYLDSNQLSGAIPSFATNTALWYLSLAGNQLSGPIPSFATNTALQMLNLGSNQLSGSIPSFATNTAVLFLYLSSNQLTGSVHSSLGTLTNLFASNGLDLRWNALFSTDVTLIAFLDSKQNGGDWQSTQTIPVTGLGVTGILPTQVTVNWAPIVYTGDSGNYQVFTSTVSGGPYTPFATVTPDKSATSLAVTGLTPLTPYYFVVQTTTAPHANNQNTVLSGYSAEIPSATTPVELMRFRIE